MQVELAPGLCAGHPAGGAAQQLVNRTTANVVCLEVGDRTEGDVGSYPADDLCAVLGPARHWMFTHEDGTPY